MRHFRVGLLITLLMLALYACASAGEFKIMDAWVKPGKIGSTSEAFLIISNATDTSDSLQSISSDAASSIEIRSQDQDKSGRITMKVIESVPVPAQQEVIFKPGELAIALTGLKQDLEPGDTIDLTFNFKNAGIMTIQANVNDH
ncbi:MAG TPA: copper chaperone PCu(A)C [Bellilinea sp.]|jgi:periplasmic copper chaperone A|nr:copper chaperone PCu(A)C [Bellilinea sp.]